MQVVEPKEAFPEIGTAENPAVLYDGNDAFLCYEASVRSGGGNVVLKFGNVIDFRVSPMNVEGLQECRYPIHAWHFNEVAGSEETAKWTPLSARLWLMSFNDVTIEALFETVSLIVHDVKGGRRPHRTLIDAL